MSKFVTAMSAAGVMVAAALCSAAQAATVSIETIHKVAGQYADGTTAQGAPLVLDLDYDDTGILSASYSIDGHVGAFDSVFMSTFHTSSRTAYGRSPVNGVKVHFTISDDGIPFNNINIRKLTFLFAAKPGAVVPTAPLTEAVLMTFFASGTTALATDYTYYANYAGTNYSYVGAFGGFSLLDTEGGEGGVTDPTLETPLPAAGLLMLGGLGAMGGMFRRGARKK